MNDEARVRRRYPEAYTWQDQDVMAYARWQIRHDGLYLGGGPTEQAAWQNAAVHIRAAELGINRGGTA